VAVDRLISAEDAGMAVDRNTDRVGAAVRHGIPSRADLYPYARLDETTG
jgi:hypothetical protein